MSKFQAGNCVGIELNEHNRFPSQQALNLKFGSIHILSIKDVTRGYYFVDGLDSSPIKIYIEDCSHVNPHVSFRFRDVTMRGKVTRGASKIKVWKYIWSRVKAADVNNVSCYIKLKGTSTKIEGILNDNKNTVYFTRNGYNYKTKVYIDEDGYLRGLTKSTPLGAKQKRNSTRFVEGKVVC